MEVGGRIAGKLLREFIGEAALADAAPAFNDEDARGLFFSGLLQTLKLGLAAEKRSGGAFGCHFGEPSGGLLKYHQNNNCRFSDPRMSLAKYHQNDNLPVNWGW